MFSFNCIVILLSVICYTLKSTNSLKYYSIHKALQFLYKLKFHSLILLIVSSLMAFLKSDKDFENTTLSSA